MLALILMLVAAICFGLAAFGVVAARINLVAVGLLAWSLAVLVPLVSAR